MASIILTGDLLDPNSSFSAGDKVRFIHQTTTGQTIKGAVSIEVMPELGNYVIELQFGNILVEYKDILSCCYVKIGVVTVNQDSTATSLPELLNAIVPPTDEQLLEFQAILADCVTAEDNAATSAAEAAASAASIDPDTIPIIFDTVAEYETHAFLLTVGKTVHLNDRKADFLVISGTGTGNDADIIASTAVSQSIDIIDEATGFVDLATYGGIAGGFDNIAIINRILTKFETNDANTSGVAIKIPKGDFYSSPFELGAGALFSRITFYGMGINSKLILLDGSDADFITVSQGFNLFYNMQVDANKDNNTTGDALFLTGSSDFTGFQKVRIRNANDYGINVSGPGQIVLDQTFIFGCNKAMLLQNCKIAIGNQSTFEDNENGGIDIIGSSSQLVVNIRDSIFENNAVSESSSSHINIVSLQEHSVVNIDGNYMNGIGSSNDPNCAGIEFGNNVNVQAFRAKGNQFRDLGLGSVIYSGTITDASENDVSGNSYDNTAKPDSEHGFERDETERYKIETPSVTLSASSGTSKFAALKTGKYTVNSIDEVYPVATSSDTGVTIKVGFTGQSSRFYTGTSEVSADEYSLFERTVINPAFDQASNTQLNVSHDSVKVGVGTVKFELDITRW